jgi:hypothetical protein
VRVDTETGVKVVLWLLGLRLPEDTDLANSTGQCLVAANYRLHGNRTGGRLVITEGGYFGG